MRVWNKRDPNVPDDAVYVGRPTKWGNPFAIGRDGSRAEVIEKYKQYLDRLLDPEEFDEQLAELRGKDLVCWCAPLACHAEVLMDRANRSE